MKKFCKLMTLVLVMALLLLTPGAPVAVNALANLTTVKSTEQYTAPTQNEMLSFESVGDYGLDTWNAPTGNYLVSQQVTAETNNKFHEEYPDNTLSTAGINNNSPYVIATNTLNMPANGAYTTNAITLAANGCYQITVNYYVVEQKNNTTHSSAFGTFYLNDQAITLLPQNQWASAAFYVRTDRLATATVTPELYFGSRTDNALGAIYFDKFTVNAINQKTFHNAVAECDPTCYLDFTADDEYVLVKAFKNQAFTTTTTTNGESYNDLPTASIPEKLGFQAEQSYFYPQSGNTNNVMLMKANNSDTALTLEGYTFQPRPHEVYMFQFYSIATAAEDFTGFYFMIGDTAEEIASLSSYPYHNGWQLNTIFFIAGHDLDQEYQLSFNLGNGSAVTGWACIDDFNIYKVNGSYAADNRSAVGVHDTYDQNADTATTDIANGYFESGTAANNVNQQDSSYPYPLIADDWETSSTTNGIVNLSSSSWRDRFGDHPGFINNNDENNHVYMMYNSTPTTNVVTSPALSTTIGATTYISFDAYSYTTTQTRAYIFSAETDDDGNITNEIMLGSYLDINNHAWHHYEFAIIESEYATTRSYYLRFAMTGIGYAYFDNVRSTTDGAFQFATETQTDAATVDLNNLLSIDKAWQATDGVTEFYCGATKNGLTLENSNGQKTIVQNTFDYNLTTDNYYEVVIYAHGVNAYLGLSNYDGLLAVTTDTVNENMLYPYKLYLQPSEEATTVNFQVTLGYVTDDADDTTAPIADGSIFISSFEINSITEDEYNHASENATNDARMKVLSLTTETDEVVDDTTSGGSSSNNFFGENWWYLVPTLITALALLLAIGTFLFRKIKFDKHITKKNTSYARDMRLKNQQKKIVAQKATKVDNVTDESQSN
ncbi:MAG: hypothetical protein NC133_00575 [Prevotella sp.]|nr:hypothetical protein [Prevotella sp.]